MRWKREKPAPAPLEYRSLDDLLDLLKKERAASLKRRKAFTIGLLLYFCIMMIIFAVITMHHGTFSGIGGMFSWIGGVAAVAYRASGTQKQAAQALKDFDDVRAVPRLLELMDYQDPELYPTAKELLIHLLPRLMASDAAILTPEHVKQLNRLAEKGAHARRSVDRTDSMPLRLNALRALEQVGDATSVEVVERIIASDRTPPDLRMEAQEALPAVRQRARNSELAGTLLRAGAAAPAERLLRAATSKPEAYSGELLRAQADCEDERVVVAHSAEQTGELETTQGIGRPDSC